MVISALLLLASLSVAADKASQREAANSKKATDKSETFTFKVPVDVVVVNAVVTDKQGNPVKDLKVEDFRVYEDGKPQAIHTFALESYKATQSQAGGRPAGAVPATEEDAGASHPRMISLVVDDLTTSAPQYFHYAREALQKLLVSGLGPSDLVSLMTTSGSLNQPFTSDKELLLSLVGELHKKVGRSGVPRSGCPELTDLQAQQIRNEHPDPMPLQVAIAETVICQHLENVLNAEQIGEGAVRSAAAAQFEENQFRYRGMLASVRQHIRSLRHFDARKSLILISDGFLSDYVRYELQDVIDMALRSSVIFNTLDVRGLYTTNYEASDRVVAGVDNRSFALLSRKPQMRIDDIRQQEDPLRQLSGETGGLHIGNTNDLAAGLRKIVDNQSFYYILSYATPNAKSDGRYHKIKLEVTRPGVQVTYRKGYYAPKEQLSFERRKKEDIIEALHAPGNLNEIPIQLSYNYFQMDDARYQLALMTQVNIRGMKFVEEDSRHKNLISLVVVAFDENDRYVDGLEKTIDLNLTSPSYSALLSRG
ncbi:MAG: VWA domain-containing protein, partial [Acidobacteria bacterium]|nr:VWA domain-containing protein [Acidobacteriota bacterium]